MNNLMKALIYLLLSLILILSLLGAYYKRSYDKEVVLHTSTKEALVEANRSLVECSAEREAYSDSITQQCEGYKEVDNEVDSIKEQINNIPNVIIKRKETENVKEVVVERHVDTINPSIDRLLSEAYDKIYLQGNTK